MNKIGHEQIIVGYGGWMPKVSFYYSLCFSIGFNFRIKWEENDFFKSAHALQPLFLFSGEYNSLYAFDLSSLFADQFSLTYKAYGHISTGFMCAQFKSLMPTSKGLAIQISDSLERKWTNPVLVTNLIICVQDEGHGCPLTRCWGRRQSVSGGAF